MTEPVYVWQTVPFEFWFWAVICVLWFACGCFTAKVAHEKGYSGGWWFLGGFLFGFFALLASVGLPDRIGGQNFAVGQRVYASGREGTIIRINRKSHSALVDDGHGKVSDCPLDEVFPKI